MSIDLEKVRADTPGVLNVTHFNNAGAALMPLPVLEAQIRHLKLESNIGGYEAALAEHTACEAVYAATAGLIGSSVNEVALVENATVAWDMAFYSITFNIKIFPTTN